MIEIFNMINVELPHKHKNKLHRMHRVNARDLSKDKIEEIEYNLVIDALFVAWVKMTCALE